MDQPEDLELHDLTAVRDRLGELLERHWGDAIGRLPEESRADVKDALAEAGGGAEDTADLLRLVADAIAVQTHDTEEIEMIEGLRFMADSMDFLDDSLDLLFDTAGVEIEEDLTDKLPVRGGEAGGLPVPFNKKAKDRLKRVPPESAPYQVKGGETDTASSFSEPPEPKGPAKLPAARPAPPEKG